MDPEAYAKHNKPETGGRLGVYKHENTEEELHCQSFPSADAAIRQGWIYSRPLPTAEEQRKVAEAAAKTDTPTTSTNEVKQLRKQLKAEKEARATAEAEAKQAQEDAQAILDASEEDKNPENTPTEDKKGAN